AGSSCWRVRSRCRREGGRAGGSDGTRGIEQRRRRRAGSTGPLLDNAKRRRRTPRRALVDESERVAGEVADVIRPALTEALASVTCPWGGAGRSFERSAT